MLDLQMPFGVPIGWEMAELELEFEFEESDAGRWSYSSGAEYNSKILVQVL